MKNTLNKKFNLFHKVKINVEDKNSRYDKVNEIKTYKKIFTQITLMQFLGKIITALKVPLVAAKHQLIIKIRTYFTTSPFPWFKLSLVLLFLYVFFQKDMQFQINMGAPSALISDDNKEGSTSGFSMNSFAQTASITSKKTSSATLQDQDVASYINRFSKVALIEMQKYEIPASIKMGQAILASQAGKNALVQQYNNHFGTLCKNGNNCKNIKINNQSFMIKTYQSAWESWRDDSNLLSTGTYVHLRKYGKNYKKWAKGLEQAGYGNHKNYSNQLIQVIERYQLYKLDELNENL